MMCVGIVLAWCFASNAGPTDSYCLSYQKVVQSKGDGSITASPAAKRRITANEINYRCRCEGWKSPLCR